MARSYAKLGCRRIVALRGDPPRGEHRFMPHPGGFPGSVELVSALAELGQFELWVACYPEIHPEAVSPQADIDHLKRKLDAGATGAITQLFFENQAFYRFRDACAASGIDAPLVPGLLPIEDFDKTVRFADSCGATVPDRLFETFDNVGDDAARDALAVGIATAQCEDLLANGVADLHFYTLNKSQLVYEVCEALGIEPAPATAAAG